MSAQIDYVGLVGERSNLLFAPELATHFLMDGSICRLPALTERLAQIALIGVLVTGLLVISLHAGTATYLLLRRDLASLRTMASALSQGNLRVRTRLSGKDEITRLGGLFDAVDDSLQTLIAAWAAAATG